MSVSVSLTVLAVADFSYRDILHLVGKLPFAERLSLVCWILHRDNCQRLVLGERNPKNCSGSPNIQLGGTAEEVSEQLQHIDRATLETLLEALADRMRQPI